jgi:hypothetical protein
MAGLMVTTNAKTNEVASLTLIVDLQWARPIKAFNSLQHSVLQLQGELVIQSFF